MNSSIQMASVAQKMASILALNCPPNYHCGGPAYAAVSAMDTILHLMGIGVSMLQRKGAERDEEFEKFVHQHAVLKKEILGGFVQHKSQILAGAIHAVVANRRGMTFREPPQVTEAALLAVIEWYVQKSGISKDEFCKRLKADTYDELIQLEKDA